MISLQKDYSRFYPDGHGNNRPGVIQHPVPILVVEDSKVCALTISRLLTKVGYDVQLAADGIEAVTACAGRMFAAILMDYEMPNMNGAEASIAIRAAERALGAHTPIIGYSASAGSTQCLAAGMDDFLHKPAAPAMLIARVAWWSAEWRRRHECVQI